jgi:hypothetical protein
MTAIFDGVRKGDVVLAVLATGLGVALMLENIFPGSDAGVRIDSHSWLLIPVFALATLPILWRRRSMLAVCLVTAAALAVHVLAFGWMVRCGAGLPLAFALAYGAGRLNDGWRSWVGLLAVTGIQVLVLVEDSAAGLDVLPFTVVIGAAVWGVGVWVRQRAGRRVAVGAPTPAVVEA